MLPSSLLALALGLSPQAPPSRPPGDLEKQFAADLALVEQAVERGSWGRAEKLLEELLERHAEAPFARRRQLEIVELARRAAFGKEVGDLKLASLVSGDLQRWDAKSGDFSILYTPDRMADFDQRRFRDGTLSAHPAVFVDTLSIEIEFDDGAIVGSSGPRIVLGVGSDEQFLVCFGEPAPASAYASRYTPPQILRTVDGKTESVDSHDKPAPAYEKRGSLKVTVGSGGVTAYRDGKRILQAKRSVRESGVVAFMDIAKWSRIRLQGRIQPSWPQGRIDTALQARREDFETRFDPELELPEWLFAPLEGAPASSAGSAAPEAAGAAFAARFQALAKEEAVPNRAARRRVFEQLAREFPSVAGAWIGLISAQLLAGELDAARASCDAAQAAGVPADDLEELPELIAKARSGPSFARSFVHESANYVVKSDIDQATCVAASKVLEESYRSYRQRLAPVPGVEKKRFAVFLFAGEAGYHDYAARTLGATPESTAGVYSSHLKQLLIWNLPDRAAMFRTVRHEGFHQYLDRLVEEPPIWFNEGLAEYYELADLFGGEWKEGQRNDDHLAVLRASPEEWVALPKLFALDHDDFYGARSRRHYAQSWLVIHWLRQGPKPAKERFDRLWNALTSGSAPAAALAAAFPPAEIATIEQELKAYLREL